MFVGEPGVNRVVQRTCEILTTTRDDDARRQGCIDLETIQRYINLWFSVSLDLFGGEVSSNAASFFAAGLKGRYQEEAHQDHVALEGVYPVAGEEVPLRNAMNELLRDAYIQDCERALERWNHTMERFGIGFRLRLPDKRFHRRIGIWGGRHFDPWGRPLTPDEWGARREEFLPSEKDRAYVNNLMAPVQEVGKIAHWIARPARGIKGLPFEFEYVRRES